MSYTGVLTVCNRSPTPSSTVTAVSPNCLQHKSNTVQYCYSCLIELSATQVQHRPVLLQPSHQTVCNTTPTPSSTATAVSSNCLQHNSNTVQYCYSRLIKLSATQVQHRPVLLQPSHRTVCNTTPTPPSTATAVSSNCLQHKSNTAQYCYSRLIELSATQVQHRPVLLQPSHQTVCNTSPTPSSTATAVSSNCLQHKSNTVQYCYSRLIKLSATQVQHRPVLLQPSHQTVCNTSPTLSSTVTTLASSFTCTVHDAASLLGDAMPTFAARAGKTFKVSFSV